MRAYLDSSAIVKRYIKETGSESIDVIYNALEQESQLEGLTFSSWNFGEGLTEDKLESTFETTMSGNKVKLSVGQMLWHLVEEELQHRGELNALFWQIDIDPPHTDWLDWKVEIGEVKPST